MLTKPFGSDTCESIQRCTKRLSHTFQSIESPNSGKHMRRICSLLPTSFEKSLCLEMLQHAFQQQHFC